MWFLWWIYLCSNGFINQLITRGRESHCNFLISTIKQTGLVNLGLAPWETPIFVRSIHHKWVSLMNVSWRLLTNRPAVIQFLDLTGFEEKYHQASRSSASFFLNMDILMQTTGSTMGYLKPSCQFSVKSPETSSIWTIDTPHWTWMKNPATPHPNMQP